MVTSSAASSNESAGPAPGLVLAMCQFQLGLKEVPHRTMEKALKEFDWQFAKVDTREAWMYYILRREAERNIKPGAMPLILSGLCASLYEKLKTKS
jgi:hypothetical protein